MPHPPKVIGEAIDLVCAAAAARDLSPAPPALAAKLADALWEVSALRHGLFTPRQFRALCTRVLEGHLQPRMENVEVSNARERR